MFPPSSSRKIVWLAAVLTVAVIVYSIARN